MERKSSTGLGGFLAMLTTAQAAEALGLQRTTVLKLIARGQLKSALVEGRRRIRQSEINRYNRIRKGPGRPAK